jgi:mono/diheme cytochrome c family protein
MKAGLYRHWMAALAWGAAATIPVAAGAQPSTVRGAQVYQANCARCHGEKADGDSPIARVISPRPPNLITSTLSAADKERIVVRGGAAVGRSPTMPEWGKELSAEDIRDVLAFVQSKHDAAMEKRP